jgi:thymidylate synthase (FAD)
MTQATFLSYEEYQQRKLQLKRRSVPCLDGFVELMDTMGTEQDIAYAARVTANTSTKLPEEDRGLLRYLLRHRHTTPLEMVELKFRVLVPMDTWRQWIRHRTANVNEYSTRYSPAIDQCQTTQPGEWRLQSKSNRQGSSGDFVTEYPEGYEVLPEFPAVLLPNEPLIYVDGTGINDTGDRPYVNLYDPAKLSAGDYLTEREAQFQEAAAEIYNERLKFGVAKEQARKDLPLSTMTMAIWKIDMHNLLHFLSLRMDGHAQLEIRTYANAIGGIVKQLYPVLWEAFEQYRLNAMTLTQLDIGVIQKITKHINSDTNGDPTEAPLADFMYCCREIWPEAKSRERDECLAKLRQLGLVRKE